MSRSIAIVVRSARNFDSHSHVGGTWEKQQKRVARLEQEGVRKRRLRRARRRIEDAANKILNSERRALDEAECLYGRRALAVADIAGHSLILFELPPTGATGEWLREHPQAWVLLHDLKRRIPIAEILSPVPSPEDNDGF